MNDKQLQRIYEWSKCIFQLGFMHDGTGYVLGKWTGASVEPMSIDDARSMIELPDAVKVLFAKLGAPPQVVGLMTLYKDMVAEPDNTLKALAYFRALAEARLSDFYTLQEGYERILDIALRFADGHDEINEYTPEPYIKLLEGYLISIGQMAKRGAQGRFGEEE